ncbi:hypothetical protein JI76_13395 [Streptomyces anulatus]|nr:hypothetical protein JI76_13395 [Streptomyces anulatus]
MVRQRRSRRAGGESSCHGWASEFWGERGRSLRGYGCGCGATGPRRSGPRRPAGPLRTRS